jgi:predicted dehydrogenase
VTTGGSIGVGMLGYAFMGKAHTRAFREARALHAPLAPELVSLSGRTAEKVETAREELGWAEAVTDWREQVADERIGLFDNGGPNALHAEPTIAAARNGKHVLCEKPLGRTADESLEIWREAERAGVMHMCGSVAPHGATFEDGYRCAEVCDAIVRSAESGKREEITYRGVAG